MCNAFQPTILEGQLCYQAIPTYDEYLYILIIDGQASFERGHKLRNGELGGLILVLDYNVER